MKKNFFDGWVNVLKGLGGSKDNSSTASFSSANLKSYHRQQLNDLYSTNWIASKAVNIPVDDALKDGVSLSLEDTKQLEIFEKGLKAFKVEEKITNLAKWSKVFGGAVIVIVTNEDTMDTPLIIDNLKQGQLKNLVVLDKFDITSVELERDPLSQNYLKPIYYQIAKGGGNVHYSRVIHLDGETTTNYNRELMNGWGLSVYEKGWTSILNATVSPDLLSNILLQSNQDVYKIAGLNDALTNGADELVLKRLQSIQESKSIFNGIALDKEDDYINIAKNFSGLESINKAFFEIVCGAYDIPYSRFMGIASTGLNATGEGDLSNYYDKVEAERTKLLPAYETIYKVMQYHLFGKNLNITFEFKPLWQMSDLETAQLNKANAEVDNLYLNMGVVNELDIKSRLVQDDRYPTITAESVEAEIALYSEMEQLEPDESFGVDEEKEQMKDELLHLKDSVKDILGLNDE